MSSYATLTDLPIELLLKIVKLLPQDDLCTHIWFYQSSRAAAAAYDFGDSFWKDACLESGLGFVPQLDKEDSETCWRDIVMDCVKHDSACKRPDCGLSLLRTNRKLLAPSRRREKVKTHDALQRITFEDVPWIKDVLRDAKLRMDTRAHRAYAFNNPVHLGCHPVAYRSFATFPPQEQLRVERIGFRLYKESDRTLPVENKFGVTVYDVIRTIYDCLELPTPFGNFEVDRNSKTLREILSTRPIKNIIYKPYYPPPGSGANCYKIYDAHMSIEC